MKVLIFPCNTLEAIIKAQELALAGHDIIGATSVASEYQLTNSAYNKILQLPFIAEDNFSTELHSLLNTEEIDLVWSSVTLVNLKLNEDLSNVKAELLSASLVPVNKFPVETIASEIAIRANYIDTINTTLNQQQTLSPKMLSYFLASIFKVPGESHFDKLLTVGSIFPDLPENTDIVEIGALWGRTAKAFCCFSQYYEKGNLLCIDPWSNGEAVVQKANKLIDNFGRNLDGDGHFSIFVANLAAEHGNKLNYLRGLSADVINYYTQAELISSEEFGTTKYQRKIGLLHIDGNHKYESVIEDIQHYAELVVSGGWIIFDDYNWAYGDGVTKACDEYLIANKERVEFAFYSGGALFVKLM